MYNRLTFHCTSHQQTTPLKNNTESCIFFYIYNNVFCYIHNSSTTTFLIPSGKIVQMYWSMNMRNNVWKIHVCFFFLRHKTKQKGQEGKVQQLKKLAFHFRPWQNSEQTEKVDIHTHTHTKILLPSFITSTIMNHDTNDTSTRQTELSVTNNICVLW